MHAFWLGLVFDQESFDRDEFSFYYKINCILRPTILIWLFLLRLIFLLRIVFRCLSLILDSLIITRPQRLCCYFLTLCTLDVTEAFHNSQKRRSCQSAKEWNIFYKLNVFFLSVLLNFNQALLLISI